MREYRSPLTLRKTGLTPSYRLLTPLYAIHPPHVLAVASILLTTRLHRIPLPKDWFLLFDVEWDEIWSCAGTVMRLWHEWGLSPTAGRTGEVSSDAWDKWEDGRATRESRWRRAWILAESRKAVRKWVEERDGES